MKFFAALLLTALLSLVSCFYLPWWSIAIVAFVVAVVIQQSPGRSFLAGYTAIFLLWSAVAGYLTFRNGNLLAQKISLLILKMDNPFLLLFITAFIGAVVAGLAALTGSYVRPIAKNR